MDAGVLLERRITRPSPELPAVDTHRHPCDYDCDDSVPPVPSLRPTLRLAVLLGGQIARTGADLGVHGLEPVHDFQG